MKTLLLKSSLVCLCATLIPACGITSFDKHNDKHKDLSLEKLLSGENLSAEKRQLFESGLIKRSELKSNSGDYASAANHARMALKLSPDDPKIKFSLAEALLGMGEHEEAEGIYAELTETDPNPLVFQGYGLTLLARNKNTDAQNWLNKAVIADSNLWRSWNGLGIIYDMSKAWKLAEQSYKAGIAVNEQNATINNNLGISYLKQNRLTEAIIAFENVRVLPGGEKLSDMNYRTALALNGDIEKAENGATDIQRAQLYNNLGVVALNRGDPETAIGYLKKAVATNPSYYANAAKNLEIAKSALQ